MKQSSTSIWHSFAFLTKGYLRPTFFLVTYLFFSITSSYSQDVLKVWTTENGPFNENLFRHVAVDGNGQVWVGTLRDGVWKYDGENWANILPAHDVRTIITDNEGDIWIGSGKEGAKALEGGIRHYTASNFEQIEGWGTTGGSNLSSRYINSLANIDGQIWAGLGQSLIGTNINEGSIAEYNNDGISWRPILNGLPEGDRRVLAIAKGNNNDILVSVDRACNAGNCAIPQLLRYDLSGNFLEKIETPIPFSEETASPRVTAIYTDSKNYTWIGTNWGAGVYRFNDIGEWEHFDIVFGSRSQVSPHAITEDKAGNIWIGTSEGLFHYLSSNTGIADLENWKIFGTENGLPSNFVTGIAFDKNEGIWVSTSSGLVEMSNPLEVNFGMDHFCQLKPIKFTPSPINLENIKANIDSLIFRFGDGTRLARSNFEADFFHTYQDQGIYLVDFSIKFKDGTSISTRKTIEIFEVPQLKIKQLDQNPNLPNYDVMGGAIIHYYLQILDKEDKTPDFATKIQYKINNVIYESTESDGTGIVDLAINTHILGTGNHIITYDSIVTPKVIELSICNKIDLIENEFQPFPINITSFKGIHKEGVFFNANVSGSICAFCVRVGPWGVKAIDVGIGGKQGIKLDFKINRNTSNDIENIDIGIKNTGANYGKLEFVKFPKIGRTKINTIGELGLEIGENKYFDTHIDFTQGDPSLRYLETLYYIVDGSYHTKSVGKLPCLIVRRLLAKYLRSKGLNNLSFSNYSNSYFIKGNGKYDLGFSLGFLGKPIDVTVVKLAKNGGYEIGSRVSETREQTDFIRQFDEYNFNFGSITIKDLAFNASLIDRNALNSIEISRVINQQGKIELGQSSKKTLNNKVYLRADSKSININSNVSDYISSNSPSNTMARFLANKKSSFGYFATSNDYQVDLTNILSIAQSGMKINKDWSLHDFKIKEDNNYSVTKKLSLPFSDHLSALLGVNINAKLEYGIFGQTKYPVHEKVFVPELSENKLIIEYPLDDLISNQPANYDEINIFGDKLMQVFSDNITNLFSIIGNYWSIVKAVVTGNLKYLSNEGIPRKLDGFTEAAAAQARNSGENTFEDQSILTITYPNDSSVFPENTETALKYFYTSGEALEVVREPMDTFIIVSDLFFFEGIAGTDTLEVAPNGDFTISTEVGKDDLRFLGIPDSANVELFYKSFADSLWTSLGMSGREIQHNGLGMYALGVRLMTDEEAPMIQSDTIRQLHIDTIFFRVSDTLSGVDWEITQCQIDGFPIAVNRKGFTDTAFVLMTNLEDSLYETSNILVSGADNFGNEAYHIIPILIDNAPPIVTITPSANTRFCQGDSLQLTAAGGGDYLWSTNETDSVITVHQSGNYTVTVTNQQGISTTQSIDIETFTLPTPFINTEDKTTVLCPDSTKTLTAIGGTTYLWEDGTTENTISITTPDTYKVTVTDENNCVAIATIPIELDTTCTTSSEPEIDPNADDDNDGIPNKDDAFPNDDSESKDNDGDGIGDNADTDDDNDGVADENDAFPLDETESKDYDEDGIGDNADTDDDNDGVADENDAFPFDETESKDNDEDGIGANQDCNDANNQLPTSPGSSCDDGNHLTKNDTIGIDGCTCIGILETDEPTDPISPPTSSPADCNALNFTTESGAIAINNLTSVYSKVQVIGENTNWSLLTICDGNCPEKTMVENLKTGDYIAKVYLGDATGNFCYTEATLSIEHNQPLSGGHPNCDSLIFSNRQQTIEIAGLTAAEDKVQLIGKNTNWEELTICDGNCSDTQKIPLAKAGDYTVKVYQGGIDGTFCYREEIISLAPDSVLSTDKAFVQLAAFPIQEQIALEWVASHPENTRYFLVEKSMDGQQFTPTSILTELANETVFSWMDEAPEKGKNYYRIRQNYDNATHRYSTTQSVPFFLNSQSIQLFPNPTNTALTLQVKALKERNGLIQIFNIYGQLVQEVHHGVIADDFMPINVATLTDGIYWLSIKADNATRVTRRFIIEHN